MCSFIKKRVGLFKNQKGFKWGFWNQRGFSLVELMVVVAIIGILASIAIPNYQRFQKKARQGEAKIGLSGMYTAQRSFITEWGYGTSCVLQHGYEREGVGYYDLGFENTQPAGNSTAGNTAAYDAGATNKAPGYTGPPCGTFQGHINGTAGGASVTLENVKSYFNGTPGSCSGTNSACTSPTTSSACTSAHSSCSWTASTGGLITPNGSVNNISFTMGAVGNIGKGTTDNDLDAWTITHQKVLTNTQSGL